MDAPAASSDARVVDLLNSASLAVEPSEKLQSLRIVQELLIHHNDAGLLDNFLDEVMGFQKDRSQEVRKLVVGFIEAACKKDPDSAFVRVVANLQMMMSDSSVTVQKRVIQAMTHLYKAALKWICSAKTVTEDMEAVWGVVGGIKDIIVHLLDADNDGIRTHTVKFMEMLVITQTSRSGQPGHDAGASASTSTDFNLDDVPLTLKVVRRRKLQDEAEHVFEELLKYHASAHISSANLMTCMGALTTIGKSRPHFLAKVITALEMLHANLPPTLAKSQVSSVRKHLKNQLLALLRHPLAAEQHFTNITTLLTDLGASKEEVMRAMPRLDEMRKRVRKAAQEKSAQEKATAHAAAAAAASKAKRPKVDIPDVGDEEDEDEDDDDEDDPNNAAADKGMTQVQTDSAVDITEKWILERMCPPLATELVLSSMGRLPHDIPPHFHNTYTPIAAAGTEGQVKHVSRLMAAQLTSAKLGPGVEQMRRNRQMREGRAQLDDDDEDEMAPGKISTVIGGSIGSKSMLEGTVERSRGKLLQPAGMNKKSSSRARALKLADITKPLSQEEQKRMLTNAIRRILGSERAAKGAGVPQVRIKIITSLAAQCSSEMKSVMLSFIFEDIKNRADLAFSWLFEEYCFYQGFNRTASMMNRRNDDAAEYNTIICYLIRGVIERTHGPEREKLLRRLYLEAPIITEDAIQILKQFVQIEGTAIAVVNLMKDLVMRRPTKKLNFLNFLLEFCSHEVQRVRETANETVLQLHKNGDFNDIIEAYAVMYLRFLLSSSPPAMLFGDDRGRPHVLTAWSEDIIKVCLYLYLSLLPQNLKLFSHLAEVYVSTTAEVKRSILRILDFPVRSIDMSSPDLLDLIETCPKGSETLVTRVVHILTDKALPTPELVNKVRDLYENRVSDVRFLIPVLNGLGKQEIIQALPKLIKLNPVVVKEVFSRLLGSNHSASGAGAVGASSGEAMADMEAGHNGPISPSDLLIALHNIDPVKGCDMKTIIKATTMCFQDKNVYTQEVLAIVLQQLMEQPTIPLLFMRTVIQAVSVYPRLIGFVMNILQRLIVKKVWKQPKVWDGFIKCCERTVPQSFAVMLQLPPQQLGKMLDAAAEMREPLLEHVQGFTESQRAHVPPNIMTVLYNADTEEAAAASVKQEPEEQPQSEESRT